MKMKTLILCDCELDMFYDDKLHYIEMDMFEDCIEMHNVYLKLKMISITLIL